MGSDPSSVVVERNAVLIEKAQRNPGSYTLIESTICSGSHFSIVMTVATGQFWTSDSTVANGLVTRRADEDDEWIEEGDDDDEPQFLTQSRDIDKA